jgi:hypothetical protein
MGKTTAERVQAYRVRQREALDEARMLLAQARDERDAALAECERLREALEQSQARECRHPAQVVQGGTCRACGQEVWL